MIDLSNSVCDSMLNVWFFGCLRISMKIAFTKQDIHIHLWFHLRERTRERNIYRLRCDESQKSLINAKRSFISLSPGLFYTQNVGPYITNNLLIKWIEGNTRFCSVQNSTHFHFKNFKQLKLKTTWFNRQWFLWQMILIKNYDDYYFAPFTYVE